MNRLLAFSLLFMFSVAAEAGIHRCENSAGETYFSDKPCAQDDVRVSVERTSEELKVIKGERMIRERDFARSAKDIRKRCMKRISSNESPTKRSKYCSGVVKQLNDCKITAINNYLSQYGKVILEVRPTA